MKPLNLDPTVNYLAQGSDVEIPEWRKSLSAFGKETKAFGAGLAALGAQVTGFEGTRDRALENYQRNMEEAQSGWRAPEVGRIEDIENVGDATTWASYQLPKGLATLATMLVGGGVGGAAAKMTAGTAAKQLAKTAVKEMAEDLAAKKAGQVVAARTGQKLLEFEAGKDAVAQLAQRQLFGARTGALGTAFGMEAGQSYGQFANDPEIGPEKAVGPALTYGAISAGLEYTPFHLAGKALGLGTDTLRAVVKSDPGLRKQALALAGKVVKGVAGGAAAEGITEGTQQLVQQAAEKYAKDDPNWAGGPKDQQEWSEFWNSLATGALVGGTAGGVIGSMSGGREEAAPPTSPAPTQPVAGQPSAAATTQSPIAGQPPAAAPPSAPVSSPPLALTSWTPTHVTSTGEPVRATTLPNIYEDANGVEIEDVYATPLPPGAGVPTGQASPAAAAPTDTDAQPATKAAIAVPGVFSAQKQPDGNWSVVAPDGTVVESDFPEEAAQDLAVVLQIMQEEQAKLAAEQAKQAGNSNAPIQSTSIVQPEVDATPADSGAGVAPAGTEGTGRPVTPGAAVPSGVRADNRGASSGSLEESSGATAEPTREPITYNAQRQPDGNWRVVASDGNVIEWDLTEEKAAAYSMVEWPMRQAAAVQPVVGQPARGEPLPDGTSPQAAPATASTPQQDLAPLFALIKGMSPYAIATKLGVTSDQALALQHLLYANGNYLNALQDADSYSNLEPKQVLQDWSQHGIPDKIIQQAVKPSDVSNSNPDMTAALDAALSGGFKAEPLTDGVPEQSASTQEQTSSGGLAEQSAVAPVTDNKPSSAEKLINAGWHVDPLKLGEKNYYTKGTAQNPEANTINLYKDTAGTWKIFTVSHYDVNEAFNSLDDAIAWLENKDLLHGYIDAVLPTTPAPAASPSLGTAAAPNPAIPVATGLPQSIDDWAPDTLPNGYSVNGYDQLVTITGKKLAIGGLSSKERIAFAHLFDEIYRSKLPAAVKADLYNALPKTPSELAAYMAAHPFKFKKADIDLISDLNIASAAMLDILHDEEKYSIEDIGVQGEKFAKKFGQSALDAVFQQDATDIKTAPSLDGWRYSEFVEKEEDLLARNPHEDVWAGVQTYGGKAARYGVIIINPETGKVLLRRVANDYEDLVWDFARGGADRNPKNTKTIPTKNPHVPGETMEHPLLAAKREAMEEFGVDVQIVGQLAQPFYSGTSGMASLYYIGIAKGPVDENFSSNETSSIVWADYWTARSLVGQVSKLPADPAMKRESDKGRGQVKANRITRTLDAVFDTTKQKSGLSYKGNQAALEAYYASSHFAKDFPSLTAKIKGKSFDNLTHLQMLELASAFWAKKTHPSQPDTAVHSHATAEFQRRKAALKLWIKETTGEDLGVSAILSPKANLTSLKPTAGATTNPKVIELWFASPTKEGFVNDVVDPAWFSTGLGSSDTHHGLFFGVSKAQVSKFHYNHQQKVLVGFKNLLVVDWGTASQPKSFSSQEFTNRVIQAKSAGYDGVLFSWVADTGNGHQVVLWNSKQILANTAEAVGFKGDTIYQSFRPDYVGETFVTPEMVPVLIDEYFGAGFTAKLQAAGRLTISTDAPMDGVAGEYNASQDVMTLYPSNMRSADDVVGVLLHEGRHARLDTILGKSLQGYYKDFENLAAVPGSLAARAAEQTIEAGRVRFNLVGDSATVRQQLRALVPDFLVQEDLANYMQLVHEAQTSQGLFRRILNAIKTWFATSKLGIMLKNAGVGFRLTDDLAVRLARQSVIASLRTKDATVKMNMDKFYAYFGHVSTKQYKTPNLAYTLAGEGYIVFGYGYYGLEGAATKAYYKKTLHANQEYGWFVDDAVLPLMLKWDQPLVKQSPTVQRLLRNPKEQHLLARAIIKARSIDTPYNTGGATELGTSFTGGSLYEALIRYFVDTKYNGNSYGVVFDAETKKQQKVRNLARREASRFLESVGILGNHYLDAGSRALRITKNGDNSFIVRKHSGTKSAIDVPMTLTEIAETYNTDIADFAKGLTVGESKRTPGLGHHNWVIWDQGTLDKMVLAYKNKIQVAKTLPSTKAVDTTGMGGLVKDQGFINEFVINPFTGKWQFTSEAEAAIKKKYGYYYSQPGQAELVSVTLEEFLAKTDTVLGQGWAQRAIDTGILQVNETSPAGSASGTYDPQTGVLTVNLDRTPKRQSVVDVLLHEGSHAGMERMLGKQFAQFHADLERLAAQGSPTAQMALLQSTMGIVDALNRQRAATGGELLASRLGDDALPKAERAAELRRVREMIRQRNPGLLREEDMAYYVQLASSANPREGGYWKRLQAAIAAWFVQTGFGKALVTLGWRPEMSPQLAVALAKRAAQQTLARAELVEKLVGEKARVLRMLPAGARVGVMESRVQHATLSRWAPELGFPRGRPRLDKLSDSMEGKFQGWGIYFGDPSIMGRYRYLAGEQGIVYDMDLPDTVLLDADRGLFRSDGAQLQDPRVAAAIKNDQLLDSLVPKHYLALAKNSDKPVVSMKGQEFYAALAKHFGGGKQASEYLRSKGIQGLKYDPAKLPGGRGKPGEGFAYVIWDQDVLDEVGQRHLDWKTGQVLESRSTSISDPASYWRSGVAESITITPQLREEAIAGQLMYSLPPLRKWGELTTWFTSPTAQVMSPGGLVPAIDQINEPGLGNKIFHGLVDRFQYVKGKSSELYRAFDEWKNRQGALQQEVQRTFLDPMRHLVSRYAPNAGDSDPIRKARLAASLTQDLNEQYTTVQIVGHQLAARHILEDNVTEKLATRASPDFLKKLKKQLSPHNVGLLQNDIKQATGGSSVIDKLSPTDARQLLEAYLPSGQADLQDRWAKFKRRSAGYTIAQPGTTEAQADMKDGFINAHELYTPQIKARQAFQEIGALSDRLAAHQLHLLQEGGLLEPAAVARLSQYAHFVPLRREEFDYDAELRDMFEKPASRIGRLMTREGNEEFPSAVHVLQNHLAAGFTAAAAAARNQMMNKFYDVVNQDRQGWRPWFTFSETRDNNGAMGLVRNGKELFIVPANGNMRAASIARVITERGAQDLAGPLKIMRAVNNWIRWSNVSASPAFMLANTPRDYLTAIYNLQASEAAAYAKEISSWQAYKDSFKALHKVMVQGVRQSNDPQEQQWIDLVEEFERAGGKTSFVEALQAMDGDSWKSFEAQVGRREGKIGAVVEWGRNKLEWLENLNITLENVMRLSTYKVMRNHVGKERAAEIARNLTTNFTRRGAHIDVINTWWLFYNATVQGNWQVVQNLLLNPNKAGARRLQKAVAGTILFAFLIDQLGRALSDDEDNDGISDWDARPDYEKERKISLPVKVGGVYPSIPAPWVFNIFWRMGGMLGEVKDGVLKPQDAVLDSIGLTVSAMDPIGVSRGTMAQALSPTAFDPFVQIIENRDFMGNPLGPDGYPGRPDAYLAWDSTPEGFKGVAEFVNEVTGGTVVESGSVDWRPSTYKVLADFMLGSLGRLGVDIGQGLGIVPGEHFLERDGPEDVSLLKTFLSAPSDSPAISLYHDRIAQVLSTKRLIKEYSEGPNRDPRRLVEVQRDRAALLRMLPQAEDVERQITSLRKAVRSAQARKDSQTEERLRERIVQLQKRFNQSFAHRVGS